jgi:hypothetical protein
VHPVVVGHVAVVLPHGQGEAHQVLHVVSAHQQSTHVPPSNKQCSKISQDTLWNSVSNELIVFLYGQTKS